MRSPPERRTVVERVLVTGGTGKTGRLVAERLGARGIAALIATRHPDAPDHIRFDWHDAATHAAALDGVNAVYLVAPTDRTEQLAAMRPFLELAVERGTGPLVLLSASSLNEGGPMMGEVHAWLHAHAARWTALRPSWFMQNFVTQHLPSIRAEGCIYSATRDGRVPFIDAADIAAAAVEALTDPSFPSGERVLTGPEALSYDQAAALIATAAGRSVRHCRLSADELALRYTSFGIPADYAALLAGMDEAIAQGAEDRTTREVERITGRPPATLETFLASHGDKFRGPGRSPS